jgi:hypothetical protein
MINSIKKIIEWDIIPIISKLLNCKALDETFFLMNEGWITAHKSISSNIMFESTTINNI